MRSSGLCAAAGGMSGSVKPAEKEAKGVEGGWDCARSKWADGSKYEKFR